MYLGLNGWDDLERSKRALFTLRSLLNTLTNK